jgi:hypothetical protein
MPSATALTRANDQAIRRALEQAGVEFIDAGGGGSGVRLRAPPDGVVDFLTQLLGPVLVGIPSYRCRKPPAETFQFLLFGGSEPVLQTSRLQLLVISR